MECQKDLKDPAEFLEGVKVDLFQDEVYVFTPKGDVRVFPRGATPIDFAYAIHSELGEHMLGRARERQASCRSATSCATATSSRSMTSPNQQPSKDWLDFVVTTRARAKIRNFLRAEQRDKSLNLGRELLERELHQRGDLAHQAPEERRTSCARSLEVLKRRQRRRALHRHRLRQDRRRRTSLDVLAPPSRTASATPPPPQRPRGAHRVGSSARSSRRDDGGIRLNGIDDVLVRYAKCCNPLPGDDILGFITRGRGVTIHRRGCPKAFDTDPERRVEITWDSKAKINRPVQLRVITANRPGILATVGHTFSEQGINISEANCRAGDDGKAVNVFTFVCSDLAQLKNVMRALQKVKGVVAVDRV